MIRSIDPVFAGTLIFSACLHFTFLTAWHNQAVRLESEASKTPAFPKVTYIGEIRESHVDSTVARHRKEAAAVTEESRKGEPVELDVGHPRKVDAAKKVATDEPKSDKEKRSRERFLHEDLVPRVENIDLRDKRILKVFSSYYAMIWKRIQERIRYPLNMARADKEGMVYVSFVLHHDGRISELHVVKGSMDDRFNSAALESIRESAPFAPFPPVIKEKRITLYLPVSFELR